MSYRLITRANFIVTSAEGTKSERIVEVRAYPAPKRDAAGLITVDGADVEFRRTGGKGRGTVDARYAYAVVKDASGFWPITEAEATALIGGRAFLDSIQAEQPKAEVEAAPEAPKAEAPKGEKAKRRGKADSETAHIQAATA